MKKQFLLIGRYLTSTVFSGVSYPVGFSFDVTHRCNMRCKHCYFHEQDAKSELSELQLLSTVKEYKKKYPSILTAAWIGGEPLLRQELVAQCLEHFAFNMIITNGTIPLPSWKNCAFNVSVDGTEEYFEMMRGKGTYKQIKRNVNRSDVYVNLSCVLNRINYTCIEAMLEEWNESHVAGINFSFYTPIKGINHDLWLDWRERDLILDKLLKLKKKYKKFLLNSRATLLLMKSENAASVTDNCMVKKAIVSLDPTGKTKSPCVLGEKADCSRCGCILPFQMAATIRQKDIETIRISFAGFGK